MKPIKLTMRAFGPYKDTEVIDFTELKDNRLFVISGQTGAGKTTIFDGISFALYGSGSGQDRKENKSMRSDFADDQVNTAVELIFEVHGRKYRVMRQLAHVKMGNKVATGEAYSFMEILPDGTEKQVVERQKVTDINQKIEEIIGLSYDQFNQIIMLPQGEFRKLLTSQSENKEAILRKIFKTERYGQIAKKLETKKQLAEQQEKIAKARRDSYIEQIAGALPHRDSLLFERLQERANLYQISEALDEELLYYQMKIKKDNKLYEEAFNKHDVQQKAFIELQRQNERISAFELKQKQLAEKQAEQPIFDAKKAQYEAALKAQQLTPLYNQCTQLKKELDEKTHAVNTLSTRANQLQQEFLQVEQQLKVENEREGERHTYVQQLAELGKLKPVYEEIDQLITTVEQLQNTVNEHQMKAQQLANDHIQLKQSADKLQLLIEQDELKIAKLPQLLEEQQFLKEVTALFAKLSEEQAVAEKIAIKLTTQQQAYEVAQKQYDVQMEKWLNSQAHTLALTLVQGEPCPVCGSTEHPAISAASLDQLDQSQLQLLKGNVDKQYQLFIELETKFKVAQQSQISFEEELQKLNVSLHANEQLMTRYEEVMSEVMHLQKLTQLVTANKQQLRDLQQQITHLEITKQQAEQLYHEANASFVQQQTVLEQKRMSMPTNAANLAQLQQMIAQVEAQLVASQKALNIAQRNYEQVHTESIKTKEILNVTTEQQQELDAKLTTAREQFVNDMKEAGFETFNHFAEASRTKEQIAELQQAYLDFSKELHALTSFVEQEQQQLADVEKVDLSQAVANLAELKQAYEEALRTVNASQECERHCIDYSEKLVAIADEITALEQISHEIIDLYNMLRGQNTKRISFERYIQMGYLEQITEAANVRLKHLSNGQYQLICSDRQESHGRQSGLSLDVYDSYTGQTRDVKSLSGGEKFNASLCLALGMADVIQSFQGSVRIDTMFIDEGFGSLDEESLMRAIDTLIDLQKSGRMIGVISHVAELKAAIPAVLQVEKLKEGFSRTSIVLK
ncbi:SMC family ATPase [Solibacillus sp. CAU 1738]|uniref:SMC family ATPase n=1 Tax=Solibacillus sp. CAU 1738 TaxID=3140363 RepID=UPI003260C3DA